MWFNTTAAVPLPSQIWQIFVEGSGFHLIHGSFGPSEFTSYRHLDWFSRFLQGARLTDVINRHTHSRHRPRYSVCSNRPHLAIVPMRPNYNNNSQMAVLCWMNTIQYSPPSCPLLCNRCYPEPTRVLDANGISLASAVFAGLTRWKTDWQTDRRCYSVGNIWRHFTFSFQFSLIFFHVRSQAAAAACLV